MMLPEMPKKTLKVRRYKAGYEIRTEYYDDSRYGGDGLTVKVAYTPSGDYIGDTKFAYRLCKKWGIRPEKISQNHSVCSIGFCEKEQRWYGWSHRSICGFAVGHKVKKGDCGYSPASAIEVYASLSKEERKKVVAMDGDKITIKDVYCLAKPMTIGKNKSDQPQEEEIDRNNPIEELREISINGRGEWVAKTLDDAKQMAIDFARGVS